MYEADVEAKAEFQQEISEADSFDHEVAAHLQEGPQLGFLGTLRHYEDLLDKKIGVEAHGPARILPEEGDPKYGKWQHQIVMCLMWASGTMNLSCFTTGFLGAEFGLSLPQTIYITMLASFVGAAITGWCATMGPPTGLRQVSICRYSIGWWPAKLIAALNVIEQIGWSSVGCITGGIALSAVSDGRVSLVLGVVIIAVVGMVFSFIGLRAVLTYEKYAWFVFFVIFMILYGKLAPQADLAAPPTATGLGNIAAGLTLFAIIYGSSASWCSIVSDFYVHYPANTSKVKVFLLTTCGIAIPTCIGMLLGCCVASNAAWANLLFKENVSVGFLLQDIVKPVGFAKFLLTVLVLSGIGTVCIANYAAALSIQQFAEPLALIPRFIWTFIVFAAIILIGVAGRNHLLTVLQNFLSLLGYWNTSLFIIISVEHYWFRKGWYGFRNYNLAAWDTRSKMPIGLAGGFAFAAGIVAAVVGMSSTWWVGPIAKKIAGGDIGNELSFLFTLVAYVPCRYLELHYFGR